MHIPDFAIAPAKIRHRRFLPKSHAFTSELSYLWFNPDQIHDMIQVSRFCSVDQWNILTLKAADFLPMETGSIRQKVAKVLLKEKHVVLTNQMSVRVLALPRTLGFRFNSVVFYFIYDRSDDISYILSEITNTPWKERHVYVHDAKPKQFKRPPYICYDFDFDKDFHVSPFMPMDIQYCWHFSFSERKNLIHMQLIRHDQLHFDASLDFSLEPITHPSQLERYAFFKFFEPFKMVMGIYWNAFRLWTKKIPFYPHPKKQKGTSL